nr:retrovirus-related Pol polyprotein from transposon TNT 1-94 [Tanacetum cinerariifolium]
MIDYNWIESMQYELNQFKRLDVRELVERPVDWNVIKVKWIWKNKMDAENTVLWTKSHLVSKGYSQEEGIDFEELFSLVARLKAVRMIVRKLLVDHALSYALTATADVAAVYIHQFLKTVKQVPNANEIICFMVHKEETTYTVDMFHSTLNLPVETPEQPFISPASLEYIQPFLKIVSYQGLVDKYPRFTKLIIADIVSKYYLVSKRLEEEYHVIIDHTLLEYKDYVETYEGVDVPMIQPKLVESTQGTNRTRRATRIPNPMDVVQKKKGQRAGGETSSPKPSLKVRIRQQKPISTPILPPSDDKELKEKILEEDVKNIVEREVDESYASEFIDSVFLDEEDSGTRIEPESHKENPKEIDNDDDEEEE